MSIGKNGHCIYSTNIVVVVLHMALELYTYSSLCKLLCLILLTQETLRELVSHYTWDLVPGQDLTYKFLPVCRPKEDVKAIFTRTPSDPS